MEIKIVSGGFSAGCDMLLQAIVFTPARCDIMILQSPWIPIRQDHSEGLVNAFKQKNIAPRILCGSDDKDCLPMAKQLFEVTTKEGLSVEIAIRESSSISQGVICFTGFIVSNLEISI